MTDITKIRAAIEAAINEKDQQYPDKAWMMTWWFDNGVSIEMTKTLGGYTPSGITPVRGSVNVVMHGGCQYRDTYYLV